MLKYLTVALLAFAPALSVFGATPAVKHRATTHSHAPQSTRSAHAVTAAQRKARLKRRTAHTTVAHRRGKHRVGTRHRAAHRTLAQRRAAHRAYERHLAHERWLRRHRAYEARLRRERRARHLAYEHRLTARRAGKPKGTSEPPAGTEVAKAESPKMGSHAPQGAAAGTMPAMPLEHVSHAHVRLYWRSPLRGTHASLARQDRRDRDEGLTRIRDEAQLQALIRGHDLIPLPLNGELQVDPRLAYDRRYTRPWTASFLRDLSRTFMRRFGQALVITSAVRPATYQRRLTWRNGNAAPANGAIASPHEFGATIDIGKKGMTAREMAWMRGYLLPIQQAGQIDVEEEFHQACFHVTVYKNYVPAPMARPQPEVAEAPMDTDAR